MNNRRDAEFAEVAQRISLWARGPTAPGTDAVYSRDLWLRPLAAARAALVALVLASGANLCLAQEGGPAGGTIGRPDVGASVAWDNNAQGHTSEFIIRIAEFGPDRYFEWESRAQQGTIRIPAEILKESRKISFARLFDNGVEIEKADFLTLWLSEKIYDDLKRDRRSPILLDSIKDEFVLQETTPYTLLIDKRPTAVSALKVKDNRGASWLFLDSKDNPIMLEYQSKYYLQKIRSLTTRGNILRWIRQK